MRWHAAARPNLPQQALPRQGFDATSRKLVSGEAAIRARHAAKPTLTNSLVSSVAIRERMSYLHFGRAPFPLGGFVHRRAALTESPPAGAID